MEFQEFIKPELLILVPVLFLIGVGIKKSAVKDTLIPLILGVIGILLSGLYVFSTSEIHGAQAVATAIFTALTQGVLVAGASVYANEIVKQARKDE